MPTWLQDRNGAEIPQNIKSLNLSALRTKVLHSQPPSTLKETSGIEVLPKRFSISPKKLSTGSPKRQSRLSSVTDQSAGQREESAVPSKLEDGNERHQE